jgi:hypothetical protein
MFQSLDTAYVTVTTGYDADSDVSSLEAAVEAVGSGVDPLAQALCDSRVGSGQPLSWRHLPTPSSGVGDVLNLQFALGKWSVCGMSVGVRVVCVVCVSGW